MFKQADNAIIEMKDPDHFRRKLDGPRYIAIVTENPVVPNTLINFALVIFLLVVLGWLYSYKDNPIFLLNRTIISLARQLSLYSF